MTDVLADFLQNEIPAALDSAKPAIWHDALRQAAEISSVGAALREISDGKARDALAEMHAGEQSLKGVQAVVRKLAHGQIIERYNWQTPPAPHKWLVEEWLSAGRLALLAGRGGTGKSKLALQLANAIASGKKEWFADGPKLTHNRSWHGTVVYATWEDDADEIARRLLNNPELGDRHAADALHGCLEDRFHALDFAGVGPIWGPGEAQHGHADPTGELTPAGEMLRARCEAIGARLLIVDPLAAAYALSENNRGAVRGFISSWDRWARDAGCAVLLIAHPPKGGEGKGDDAFYAGSTDWYNGVRSMLTLGALNHAAADPEAVRDTAELRVRKVSYGKRPPPVTIENWKWWRAGTATGGSDAGRRQRQPLGG